MRQRGVSVMDSDVELVSQDLNRSFFHDASRVFMISGRVSVVFIFDIFATQTLPKPEYVISEIVDEDVLSHNLSEKLDPFFVVDLGEHDRREFVPKVPSSQDRIVRVVLDFSEMQARPEFDVNPLPKDNDSPFSEDIDFK